MDEITGQPGHRHRALIYQGTADCLASMLAFIQDGLARNEPVSVAVSAPNALLLRQAVGDGNRDVEFHEMAELGRNPARILSAANDLITRHGGGPVRWLHEPLWPKRSAAEVTETVRAEVLANLAFRAAPMSMLCLYDIKQLSHGLAVAAEQTHPVVSAEDHTWASEKYLGSGVFPRRYDRPLTAVPEGATRLYYRSDLRAVREHVAVQATAAGLPRGRTADLMIAVSEIAGNTLQHTSAGGWLRVWCAADEVICQVNDQGTIKDPLAGCRRPGQAASGYGLWVANQICDLVELRSVPRGTTVRLRMRL